jgi:hypothetical protein
MADKKISALTGATTPVAGTEVLPIVQSSATVKVAISDLTAGRAVSALSYASTATTGTAPFTVASTTNVANLNASSLSGKTFAAPGTIGGTTSSSATFTTLTSNDKFTVNGYYIAASLATVGDNSLGVFNNVVNPGYQLLCGIASSGYTPYIQGYNANTVAATGLRLQPFGGDVEIGKENLVLNTAAKGINFTANTPKAGMTSQLLNWYEEGTWTPTLGGNTTYTRQQGRYIRNGKMCTVMASVVVNVLGTGSINTISGLPFNSALISIGGASVSYFESIATNLVSIFGRLGQNDSYIEFTGISLPSTNPNQGNIFGNSTQLDFSATYIIQ